ncbi:hypothetical protein RMQ97_00290 [Maricaulis sp. D1M11]|uniref:hypothetical protein n=1 Tax=Maricaulis sp. D1M11 TaxID=3076117 RepID=UPI0039B522BE
MPVLVEALTIIVRKAAVEALPDGGERLDGRLKGTPSQRNDGELYACTLVTPEDVQAFAKSLEDEGLVLVEDKKARDFCIVDQNDGPTLPCDWLELMHYPWQDKPDQLILIARQTGSRVARVSMPAEWDWDRSMSKNAQRTSVPD